MTKKWNLETSNAETGLKIGIYGKTEQNRSCWKFLTLVKVNGQRSTDDVAVWRHLGLTWQDVKHSRRVERVGERGTGAWGVWQILAARGDAWWRMLVRQELQPTRGGACDAVSGRSWLGFARDWPFCLPMPFLWLLNEQNVDIRELQVLWAWQRWLASDSDYWMKVRAAEERRRYPQEPESQRNGSDTMLTI